MLGTICRSSTAQIPGTAESAASGGSASALQDNEERRVLSPTHLRGSVRNMAGPQSMFSVTSDGRQGALFSTERQAIYDEGTLEYLSAEMSFSALYMHDIHRLRRTHTQQEALSDDDRARAVWQTDTGSLPLSPPSFLPMPNIQEEEDAASVAGVETDYLLRMEAGRNEFT
jgi:hypothetical protein